MQYKQLGSTDLKVSVLGYGAWALGGGGWDGIDLNQAMDTLQHAYEKGINFFDTAPIYGMGKSEERLGSFLKGIRKDVVLATKCGLLWNDSGNVRQDISREAILQDVENSLSRLQTDYIDLYQIHWPDNRTPFKETFSTLNRLQEQGVIRYIGLSNYDFAGLQKASEFSEIASLQNQYNMLQRQDEETILPYCREKGIGYIPYSPLAQGLLSGKITEDYTPEPGSARSHNPLFTDREKFRESLAFTERLEKPPAQTAIRFLLREPAVSSVIVSVTKPHHLEANLQAVASFDDATGAG